MLQTKVFPAIKDHCIAQGYRFQPIDLRWGINDEAQLDQQTLELCLSEVRACKSYPHPNFLLMLGDRYGWIPLPYCIEQAEFETLLTFTTEQEKARLLSWYQLDKNQLPASYLLKPRSGEYVAAANWATVEETLLTALQQAAKQSTLSAEQQRKYFTSATEAEIIEGIFNYENPTDYQQQLLRADPTIKDQEKDYLFSFIRNIQTDSKQSDTFINADYDQAQAVKRKVEQLLKPENLFTTSTTQTDTQSLDEHYLTEFAERVTDFLKNKLAEQIAKETTYSEAELEQQEQAYFAQQKRQDFIGQQKTLDKILNYINDENQRTAFVLYGQSGSGKSAIMAQAIAMAAQSQHRVIYRFVGATPNAASILSIFQSIFAELGIDATFNAEDESFEKISEKLKNDILSIDHSVVIFIDAVDQLAHNDQFLWLPSILPAHIKIVISALNDTNYAGDSRYFEHLQELTPNIHAVKRFSKPETLLLNLLQKDRRTLQAHQLQYFLNQYQTCQTPLYIYIAAQELKHWKSFELTPEQTPEQASEQTADNPPNIQTLADSQRTVTEEFIGNLSCIFHHDKAFVQKVLAYLYASKEGLSENEILILLNADSDFIQQVAPETFHKNSDKQLPIILWTRLYYQLKPFLSQKQQHNEALLFFFHREFIDIVASNPTVTTESEQLIDTTQAVILTNHNQGFNANRWGILYSEALAQYIANDSRKTPDKNIENCRFSNHHWFTNLLSIDEQYLSKLIWYNLHKYDRYTNRNFNALEVAYFISKPLYQQNPEQWAKHYTIILNSLAFSYKSLNRIKEAIDLQEQTLAISKPLYQQKPEKWAEDYTRSLNNLASSYYNINRIKEAISLEEQALATRKALYQQHPEKWAEDYTISLNNLAVFYKSLNRIKEAISLQEQALAINKALYQQHPEKWAEYYTISLNNLASSYYSINRIKEAISLEEQTLAISKALYQQHPEKWAEGYTISINNLAYSYNSINRVEEAISLQEQTLAISKALYQQHPEKWAEDYTRSLNNLALSYKSLNRIKEAIDLQEQTLAISKALYQQNPEKWVEDYTRSLLNLATSKSINRIKEAISLKEEALAISKALHQQTPEKWVEVYTISLNSLAYSYKSINRVEEAISLQEEALTISKALYQQHPEKWAKDYTNSLNKLAYSYEKTGRVKDAIKLVDEALLILKECYKKTPKKWKKDYQHTKAFSQHLKKSQPYNKKTTTKRKNKRRKNKRGK